MERKRPFLLSSRESPKSKMLKIDESATLRTSTIDLAIPISSYKRDDDDNNNTRNRFKKSSLRVSGDIDLTYPFWNDREDQTLNPPLVNPPLYDNKGYLDIKMSPPLSVKNDSLSLNFVSPLSLQNNDLIVSIDENSPIVLSGGKISLSVGNGLRVESNSLIINSNDNVFSYLNGVLNVKTSKPIEVTQDGISINIDNTIFEISNNMLKFKLNFPFSIDNGLKLMYDVNSLEINTSNQLAIKYEDPIKISSTGVGLNYNSDDFNLNSSQLSIKTVAPLSSSLNGITLNFNSEIFEINNSNLSIKFISPIKVSSSGVYLDFDQNSISMNQSISVNIDPDGGLQSTNSGISIKLANLSGLKISNAGISCNYGQGLKDGTGGTITVKTTYPLNVSDAGIGLNIGKGLELNGSFLRVKTGSGINYDADGGLQFQYSIGRGLEISGSYLRVKNGNGITSDTSTGISVNYDVPLTISSGKLTLAYDSNSLKVENGKLAILNNPTYNFVYAEYGSEAFNSFCQVFVPGVAWNQCRVRPFITLAWMGSTVSGILRMKLVSSDFNNATTSTPIKIGMVFDPLQDPSLVQTPVVTSKYPNENSTLDKMRPSNYYINNAINFYDLSGSPWFVDTDRMKWYYTTSFKPDKSGSFANLLESKIYMTSMIHRTRAVLYFMIHILTESSGGSFFDPKDSSKEIYIIDVPFTYSGLKVNASP